MPALVEPLGGIELFELLSQGAEAVRADRVSSSFMHLYVQVDTAASDCRECGQEVSWEETP